MSSRPGQGRLHLELLKREGCTPRSRVLEVGCGCLNAGRWIMHYLDAGNYVGIEPGEWLIKAALEIPKIRRLVKNKRPVFLSCHDFDATTIGVLFDLIYSHSVLSHCAGHQLPQFLVNAEKALSPEGRILASIRLSEGNPFGSRGSPDGGDSNCTSWQYPCVTYFRRATVEAVAAQCGLTATVVPEYTQFMVSRAPSHVHDWIVFRRIP
ncbi:MAG: class I SAM-dependent methyltransferase [Acidobacteriota bacterium]